VNDISAVTLDSMLT